MDRGVGAGLSPFISGVFPTVRSSTTVVARRNELPVPLGRSLAIAAMVVAMTGMVLASPHRKGGGGDAASGGGASGNSGSGGGASARSGSDSGGRGGGSSSRSGDSDGSRRGSSGGGGSATCDSKVLEAMDVNVLLGTPAHQARHDAVAGLAPHLAPLWAPSVVKSIADAASGLKAISIGAETCPAGRAPRSPAALLPLAARTHPPTPRPPLPLRAPSLPPRPPSPGHSPSPPVRWASPAQSTFPSSSDPSQPRSRRAVTPPSTIGAYVRAGQYVQIRLPGSASKGSAFAIASAPTAAGGGALELLVKERPPSQWSDGTGWLTGLDIGATVDVSRVMGQGFLRAADALRDIEHALLFAAGSGITAIRALIEGCELHGVRSIHLYYGARTPQHMAYTDMFAAWARRGVVVTPVISRPAGTGWTGATGYVQDTCRSDGVPRPESTAVLLCGMKGMADGVRALATDVGIRPEKVYAIV